VVALFFSVVPRGRAIGLLATKGIPLRIAADIRGGQSLMILGVKLGFPRSCRTVVSEEEDCFYYCS